MRTESPESAWPPGRRPQETALSHLPKEGRSTRKEAREQPPDAPESQAV